MNLLKDLYRPSSQGMDSFSIPQINIPNMQCMGLSDSLHFSSADENKKNMHAIREDGMHAFTLVNSI